MGGKPKKTHEQFKKELLEKRPDLEVLEEYKGARTKIKFKCLVCGTIFEATPDNMLRMKGCPNCKLEKISKAKRFGKENMQKELDKHYNGVLEILNGENTNKPIEVLCHDCGYKYKTQFYSLNNGNGCPNCMNGSFYILPPEIFFKRVAEQNPNVICKSEFTGVKNPMECECKVCHYEWTTSAGHLVGYKNTGCPKCNGFVTLTHEEYLEKLNSENPNVICKSIFVDSNTNLDFGCKICGYEWNTNPYHLIGVHKTFCPNCQRIKNGLANRKQQEVFEKEIKSINKHLALVSEYKTCHDYVDIMCDRCKYIFSRKPTSITGRKSLGCPFCDSKISSGERAILELLESNHIEYIHQMTYKDLLGVKEKLLSYDFYLPKYNLLIEFQGGQHEKPIDLFGGEEQFKIQQEHDKRKKEYAKLHNIKLLEIWYYDFDNITEILNKELGLS